MASTISDLAWKTCCPLRSTSTPMTSPMRQPGVPIISKPAGVGAKQRDAAVANDADTIRETLEGLQLKSF